MPDTMPPAGRHMAPDTDALPDDAWLGGDEAARVRLAARAATPPSVLQRLAQDPSATVRAAVAMNPAMAPEADRHLLADTDERIRILLMGKLAALLPGLSRAGAGRGSHSDAGHPDTGRAAAMSPAMSATLAHVTTSLERLADDVATRVRTALASTLARMPEAPRSVMLRLARDAVPSVSDPVLRLCPLLTDTDLLDLLASPPHPGAGHSIAGRPGLAADVSDHIAATAHADVVRSLLQNHSAVIRERTLDALVSRAAGNPDWHEPLIRRPALPQGATRALLSLVARDLRSLLAIEGELPPDLDATLGEELAAALVPGAAAETTKPTPATPLPAIARDGEPEQALLAAIAAGDAARARLLLAGAAGVVEAAVEHAITVRSAKSLVSLAWKGGFTPRTARMLVTLLGLPAGSWDQHYPFSPSEMEWQIELLDRPRGEADQVPASRPAGTAPGRPSARTTRPTKAGSPRVTT